MVDPYLRIKLLKNKPEVFNPQANLSPKNRLKQLFWVITNLLVCTAYHIVIHFMFEKNDPERMSGSSETYLFNASYMYNMDPSNKVTRRFEYMRLFC